MSIISKVGRKHPKVRLLYSVIYLMLAAGAVTMIYPFLVMISGSTKSGVDQVQMDIVPRFLRDDLVLYRKHAEGLFNESVVKMKEVYDTDTSSFRTLQPPTRVNRKLVNEWEQFLSRSELPPYSYGCGYMDARVSKTIPGAQRDFKYHVARKYNGDIDNVNRALGTHFSSWNWFFDDSSGGEKSLLLSVDALPRFIKPADTPFMREFESFKAGQPNGNRYYLNVEGFYRNRYLKSQYTSDIGAFNSAHGTEYRSYDEIILPRDCSGLRGKELEDWLTFVRYTLNSLWIRVDGRALPGYRAFLSARCKGDVSVMNRMYGTDYQSFDDVSLIMEPPYSGTVLSDWELFIAGWRDPETGRHHQVPPDCLRIHSVENMFRDSLLDKYGDLAGVNTVLGTNSRTLYEIRPPQKEQHYLAFLENRKQLRREFATRNYRTVLDYLVFHGRGIINTAIYCGLAILFALIVNPMAAYAMSRYRMPSTYKMLLFLMLTMAFPPMVTQIPVFLMLREMNLLNTFAALVLPGMANGYSIFLLKGFFDSLPRELYESAQLDGANEWTMFWRITMSLSKPILAVIALQAFTLAYSNFMFALLICQDDRMWTLMVWLYQLHQRSGQAVVYASLIIAAVPTFLIFVFCQKIIMRGIVVPSEK